MSSIKVLTVCLGNICRSPAAQGILEYVASSSSVILEVDSAGTAAYHVGNSPDPRSIAALDKIGIDISLQRARQVQVSDFDEFDWILAMDSANLERLQQIQPTNSRAKLVLFGSFSHAVDFGEVDDPYYGGDDGFITMRTHLNDIANAFLTHLIDQKASC